MTTRRELLIAFGGALAAPVAVYAQPQNKVWRVGFLSMRRIEFVDSDYYYGPFRGRLRELGYVEGRNLVIEWRSAEAEEIDQAFASMRQHDAGALLLFGDGLFLQQIKQINGLLVKYRLPAIAGNRQQAGEGMLITYGVNAADQWRGAAVYVDKIFKGAKPADLPIEQPTKFDLIINERVAKSLGLTIPPALRISATEIIK